MSPDVATLAVAHTAKGKEPAQRAPAVAKKVPVPLAPPPAPPPAPPKAPPTTQQTTMKAAAALDLLRIPTMPAVRKTTTVSAAPSSSDGGEGKRGRGRPRGAFRLVLRFGRV